MPSLTIIAGNVNIGTASFAGYNVSNQAFRASSLLPISRLLGLHNMLALGPLV